MFNSTERHYHTHNVNVTEKRATTDDSVRLLKEFEKAAQDKFIGSFDLPTNDIKSRVALSKDYINGKNVFHILLEINGKRHVIEVASDEFDDRRAQIETLYEALSEKVAQIIMPDVFDVAIGQRIF